MYPLGVVPLQHIVLPARSPDLHLLVEHCFGRLKPDLVVAMYNVGWENVRQEWAVRWVLDWCIAIDPKTIRADMKHLPKLYTAVSKPRGEVWNVDGTVVVGTAGGYAKKGIS